MTIKKPPRMTRDKAMSWSFIILDAIAKAKKYKTVITLDVGKETSAIMVENTLTNMAIQGDEAAMFIQVKLHTLH